MATKDTKQEAQDKREETKRQVTAEERANEKAQAKADAQEATKQALRDAESREEERKRVIEESQEPDLAEGQQTGGTHDAVTQADVHVEPKKAKAVYGTEARGAQADRYQAPVKHRNQPVEYAAKAELEVPSKDPYEGMEGMHRFIREAEDEALEKGTNVVVVEISYPGAPEGIYEGRDAGIRLRDGGEGVKFSDGTSR